MDLIQRLRKFGDDLSVACSIGRDTSLEAADEIERLRAERGQSQFCPECNRLATENAELTELGETVSKELVRNTFDFVAKIEKLQAENAELKAISCDCVTTTHPDGTSETRCGSGQMMRHVKALELEVSTLKVKLEAVQAIKTNWLNETNRVLHELHQAEAENAELLAELLRVKEICLREVGIGVVNEVVLARVKGQA